MNDFSEEYERLIRKYTQLRDWGVVQALFFDYGNHLEELEKEKSNGAH